MLLSFVSRPGLEEVPEGVEPLGPEALVEAQPGAIDGARLALLPGVGHDLPAAVWPRVATEVRALADRAPVSPGG